MLANVLIGVAVVQAYLVILVIEIKTKRLVFKRLAKMDIMLAARTDG